METIATWFSIACAVVSVITIFINSVAQQLTT